MRTLAALSLTACLSSPTGLDNAWPPAGIEVVAAIPLERGGGDDDLAVAVTGAHQGVFLVTAGSDFSFDNDPPFATFTAHHARTIEGPIALYQNGDDLIIASRTDDGIELEVIDSRTLEPERTVEVDIQPPEDQLRITPVTFPGPAGVADRMALISDSQIKHITLDYKDIKDIPAPPGQWRAPQLAFSYDKAGVRTAVVATVEELFESNIPTSEDMTGFMQWTPLRTAKAWPAQTTADLDGDGSLELYGFDGLFVCGFDPLHSTEPSCVPGPQAFEDQRAQLFATPLDQNPILDLAVVIDSGTSSKLSLLGDCSMTSGTLACDMPIVKPAIELEASIPVLIRSRNHDDFLWIGRDGRNAGEIRP